MMASTPQSVPDTYAGHAVIALRFTEGPRAGKWCRVFYGKANNPMLALATADWRASGACGAMWSKSQALRAVRTLRKLREIGRTEKLEVMQRFRVAGRFEWRPV